VGLIISQHQSMFRPLRQVGEDEKGRLRKASSSLLLVVYLLHVHLLAWSQPLLPNGDDFM